MRITNNMINGNTKNNINNNKVLVDKYNTQMSTQKKISKASENPVIAIRSLRLSTTSTHLDQYDTNIDDADSWLDVTETALKNMKKILTDVRTQCVNGSTDTLTSDDRNTILKTLNAYVGQVYAEGNADYAGRTVFTGYRTSNKLTFDTTENDTSYEISQNFSASDLEEHRYYSGDVEVPATVSIGDEECSTNVEENSYERFRLAYGTINKVSSLEISLADGTSVEVDLDAGTLTSTLTTTDDDGIETTYTDDSYGTVKQYQSYEDWEEASNGKVVDANEVVIIESTGEIIFGSDLSDAFKNGEAEMSVTYLKTGFEAGEARPEYYYDCREVTGCLNDDGDVDEDLAVKQATDYTKANQEISYTIAANTTLTVNTQASDVFDTSIKRDVDEMINVVSASINAHEKVDSIKEMMSENQYEDSEYQEILQTYLDAAQKEADYADDNLQKTYSQYITNFDNYLQDVNLAITNVGTTMSRLELTRTRVENQQTTVEELKSNNEDRDISDIIIDYYAAYNAYTSSLTAASKVGDQTLLDYLS